MRRAPDPRPGGQLPRRATDRVEDAVAWILAAAALALVVVAALTGIAVRVPFGVRQGCRTSVRHRRQGTSSA